MNLFSTTLTQRCHCQLLTNSIKPVSFSVLNQGSVATSKTDNIRLNPRLSTVENGIISFAIQYATELVNFFHCLLFLEYFSSLSSDCCSVCCWLEQYYLAVMSSSLVQQIVLDVYFSSEKKDLMYYYLLLKYPSYTIYKLLLHNQLDFHQYHIRSQIMSMRLN